MSINFCLPLSQMPVYLSFSYSSPISFSSSLEKSLKTKSKDFPSKKLVVFYLPSTNKSNLKKQSTINQALSSIDAGRTFKNNLTMKQDIICSTSVLSFCNLLFSRVFLFLLKASLYSFNSAQRKPSLE